MSGLTAIRARQRGRESNHHMTEDFSSAFEDLRPRSWLDAFPWIKGASAETSPWWTESIDDASSPMRRQRLAHISELAMERLSHWTIGQIFPGLPPELDLLTLPLPGRAANALVREQFTTGADLMSLTIASIMGWRQVGVGTVDAILQALADASTSAATPTVTTGHAPSKVVAPVPDDVRLPDWTSSLIGDLSQIAGWYTVIGLPDQLVLGAPLPPGTPDEIVKARHRLEELRVSDVLPAGDSATDVAALFDEALASLDSRAGRILSDRLFADNPLTLDQIGLVHGVTRERIRQIEGKARGAMLEFISDGGALAMVADAARTLIGTIRPLEELLTLMPALARTVESVGQPAWRVLDRLDDTYEIEDGWAVVPTMSAAKALTQTQFAGAGRPVWRGPPGQSRPRRDLSTRSADRVDGHMACSLRLRRARRPCFDPHSVGRRVRRRHLVDRRVAAQLSGDCRPLCLRTQRRVVAQRHEQR